MTKKTSAFSSHSYNYTKKRRKRRGRRSKKQGVLSRFFGIPSSNKLVALLFLLILIAVIVLVAVTVSKIERIQINQKMASIEVYIDAACEEFGLPKALVYAVIKTESDFEPDAESNKNARGLMQLTKAAIEDVNRILGENYSFSEMFDPEVNIRCGVCYLSYLYNYFKDYEAAIAAYNAGIGHVTEWLSNKEYASGGKLTKIPFPETSNYVKKVFRYWEDYKKIYG